MIVYLSKAKLAKIIIDTLLEANPLERMWDSLKKSSKIKFGKGSASVEVDFEISGSSFSADSILSFYKALRCLEKQDRLVHFGHDTTTFLPETYYYYEGALISDIVGRVCEYDKIIPLEIGIEHQRFNKIILPCSAQYCSILDTRMSMLKNKIEADFYSNSELAAAALLPKEQRMKLYSNIQMIFKPLGFDDDTNAIIGTPLLIKTPSNSPTYYDFVSGRRKNKEQDA